MMNKKMIGAALFCLPSFAFAHPGHGESFLSAFAHPFTGVDHLLMMLCVGIFAGRIGGSARWQLPLAFLSAMAIGWLSAVAGLTFGAIESGIAAGLIALGVMFLLQITMPFAIQLSVVAIFAALHGLAHGTELSGSAPIATGIGMLAATALLHGLGLVIANLLSKTNVNIYREMGALLTVVGSALLIAA
ncbi:MAG: HupE/UreJ family protein [Spongiibacteraceae bacterium]